MLGETQMIAYPQFDPVAFKLGPINVHWYGIMYLIGFAMAWLLGIWRASKPNSGWTKTQVGDLIFYAAIGVILGGRIGYMLFYNLSYFIEHPLAIFKVWNGGMSFHGGLIGVGIAMWVFSLTIKKSVWDTIDFIVPLVPIGLAVGRLGNFINGELWGRITNVPWAMIFPKAGTMPRHPSQLYEFLLEGVLLFIIMWCFSAKPKPRFAVSALFLFCYGSLRFFSEFFRQPDPQWGFIAWGWLTMGQLLSIPMIIIGVLSLFWMCYYKTKCGACSKFISGSR